MRQEKQALPSRDRLKDIVDVCEMTEGKVLTVDAKAFNMAKINHQIDTAQENMISYQATASVSIRGIARSFPQRVRDG